MSLSWISSDSLALHIDTLQEAASRASSGAETKRRKNVIDPFSSLLVASAFDVNEAAKLIALQNVESGLRGMSNALGQFHQNVLASVDGWEDHNKGYDLKCPRRCILAEIKNKWNTMNTGNRREVVRELETAIRQKSGQWHGYLVLVIPKNPTRYEVELSSRVYEIDGASFYHKVTGEPNAIHDLFDHLCCVMKQSADIVGHCRIIMEKTLPPRIDSAINHTERRNK